MKPAGGKRCPQCGRIFPGDAIFCDQDASSLVRTRQTWPWVVGVVATVVVILAAGVAVLGPSWFKDRISVEFAGIAAGSQPAGWGSFQPELQLKIHNTSFISPVLHSIQLRCSVSGREVLSLGWPNSGESELTISAGQTTPVSLKLEPRDIDPFAIAIGGAGDVLCKGPVDVSAWGVHATRPIEFQRKFW